MAWAKNGTPDTLTSTADTVQISDLSESKFNQIMYHGSFSGTGAVGHRLRFDGLSTSIYAVRFTEDGLADVAQTTQPQINLNPTAPSVSETMMEIGYIISISGEEKLYIGWSSFSTSSASSSVPSRAEITGKSGLIHQMQLMR